MQSLHIENYKNFRKLDISKLRKVNLIVGRNSVGKSNLLESIFAFAKHGHDFCMKEISESRGMWQGSRYAKDSYLSFFYNYEESYSEKAKIVIADKIAQEYLNLSLVYFIENSPFHETIQSGGLYSCTQEQLDQISPTPSIEGIGFRCETEEYDSALNFSKHSFTSTEGGRVVFYTVRTRCEITYARNPVDDSKNAQLFDRITLSPEEDFVLDALRIIEPRIERLSFISRDAETAERQAIVTLQGESHRYALSTMGDGINRILNIILTMLQCKGGIYLLDELETGLHYSVQRQLWEIIFQLAERLNIQVFATSHSNDAVRTFAATMKGHDAQMLRLEQRGDDIVAIAYDNADDIRFATDNNIEIR